MAFRLPDSPHGTASEGWTREDVERWLTDFPLPAAFTFNGQKVWPRYQLKCGYGQWLRTAGPYHKALRGLFALVCEILINWPVGHKLPTPDQLADKINEIMAAQGELPLSAEDTADPTGAAHPNEDFSSLADDPEPAL